MARLRLAELAALDQLSSRLYLAARDVTGPGPAELLKNVACALLEAQRGDQAVMTLLLVDELLHALHRDGHLEAETAAALLLGTRMALEPDPDAPAPRQEVQ